MIESLKTLLITIGGYGVAMIIAGCTVCGISWLLREERGRTQTITMIVLISFLIIYPAILLIQGCMEPDSDMPYNDNPYQENIYDRYN